MRIAVLCNNQMALPAIGALLQNGMLVGLATPQHVTDAAEQVQAIAGAHGIPLARVARENPVVVLGQLIEKVQADAVFVLAFPFKISECLQNQPRFGFSLLFSWSTANGSNGVATFTGLTLTYTATADQQCHHIHHQPAAHPEWLGFLGNI